MARWGALFFAAGGLFGLVSLAVPDTAVDDRTLLLAVSIASLAVAALAQRMEVLDREGHPVHLLLAAFAYWPWLLKEIVKSGWQVTRIILDPRLPISPTLVRFRPSQKTTVALATHANSITLTPGTITVEARHDEFLVHALTREGAAAVVDSEMDRRVSRLDVEA
jgi:multicomponent Na+:H+ antiporter subunit E